MHPSAMTLGKIFFETYIGQTHPMTVVDIGALNVNGSLREVCPPHVTYVGVDCVEGNGVDIVLQNPYQLPFADQSIEVVVCSSVFEHAPFFWELFLEIIRILKPHGLLYINVPSNGYIHRYPVDCWRFYPDAGLALIEWAQHRGYEPALLESFVNEQPVDVQQDPASAIWNDFVAVFVKDQRMRERYEQRILDHHVRYHNAICDKPSIDLKSTALNEDLQCIMNQAASLDALKKSAEQLTQSLREEEARTITANHVVNALRTSTSWRLTLPLRWLASQCRQLKHVSRTLAGLQRRERWARLAQRAVHIRRQEGVLRLIARGVTYIGGKPSIRETAEALQARPAIAVVEFDPIDEGFIAYRNNPAIDPAIKLIAFYLPQFHPFPENDAWWGKGFTEWTNVCKARPNYVGHYQPHLPIHFGYYDLRVPDVMEEQARLARAYGISGFNYYFYWFAGKILMDTPLEMMLANPKVDIPFCLTWANENWTRRWDGQEQDVLIAQQHSEEDSLAFIRHLIKYFNDDRYIKIDGKPVLVIYRANIIPQVATVARLWRNEVLAHGLPGLYLVCAQTFGIRSPEAFGFDAAMEFPPHTTHSDTLNDQLAVSNPLFAGSIYDYEQVVGHAARAPEPEYKLFRSAMLSWDNTARKQDNSHIFHGFSLLRYKQWLSSICTRMFNNDKYGRDEKLVFINAWNEWAEGTHLEPDRKRGYGYLQASYDVASQFDLGTCSRLTAPLPTRRHALAAVVHLHYLDTWEDTQRSLSILKGLGCDLYVSVTRIELAKAVLNDFPDACVSIVENRGRDVLPLLATLSRIVAMGYTAICKLHGKKSSYRKDGDQIRGEIFDALIGNVENLQQCVSRFEKNEALGMLVPEAYLLAHSARNMLHNQARVEALCGKLEVEYRVDAFPAGSMFWFRAEALQGLLKLNETDFAIESGLCDGTLPHAVERVFCLLAKDRGYAVEVC